MGTFEEKLAEIEQLETDATAYSIGYNIKEGEARIKFHNDLGTLSCFVTDAPGIYELAQRLLRAYDKLEGL